MAAEMKVKDAALQAAMDAAQKFASENTVSMYATAADLLREEMRAALEAALAAMLEPAPQINISERCEKCGDVLHVGVSVSNHFRIKPE